ncbi:MAG: penicillin-binding protein, partial [Rhodospirillales bacterium]|nr:penicillin-binding protein [Acetobacter sp.]
HDIATSFSFDGQTYTPRNYKGEYHGDVTAIYALAHSLNNATISLGQQVGFGNVAALARSSGIASAKGTPSVSLGTYAASPLDMAGAYTVFANGGVHLTPWLLSGVRNAQGDVVADYTPDGKQVMSPKAAYLTQNLLEGVMNFGYGVAVRKLGFTAPAAGKTGTDNDAWFAAYTSNLICIIWVGNDDYSDIKLQGAQAAAPIWAAFMNRAIRLPQYSDMKAFSPVPDGIQLVRIDRASNLPADESCPGDSYPAAFLTGTVPQSTCSHMGIDAQTLGTQLFGDGTNTGAPLVTPGIAGQAAPRPGQPASVPQPRPGEPAQPQNGEPNATQPDEHKHRNVFQKMLGIGKPKQPADEEQQPPK